MFYVKMSTPLSKVSSAQYREMVRIPCGDVTLEGDLAISPKAPGLVLFVHGSGSSRHSPRNQFVADVIRKTGIGTLLFDLLTTDEEVEDSVTSRLRFDIAMLADRLIAVTRWVNRHMPQYRIGYFGSSTGGGAALVGAAELGNLISAIVSRGGRPDLAGEALPKVLAPTLLIVGEYDDVVIRLNEGAFAELKCQKGLSIVPRATHLFEEPGALKEVAQLAAEWFQRHIGNDGNISSNEAAFESGRY
jgi:putative phosphoribosyl transferase